MEDYILDHNHNKINHNKIYFDIFSYILKKIIQISNNKNVNFNL